MASLTYVKSVAELVDPKAASQSLAWTAAGASDSATWTGVSINREAFATGSLPRSVDVFAVYDATLASGSTLAFSFDVQDSPDGTNWSDYVTAASRVVATGPSGGGRVTGVARFVNPKSANDPIGTPGVDLNGARQYIRVLVVPDLSRAGTDTAVMQVAAEFGGFDFLAAPQA